MSVRLRHPSFRNCNYVVELSTPMHNPAGKFCPKCNRGRDPLDPIIHKNKSIHLDLDSEGYCFIHPDILPLLRTVPTMAGLEVVNETFNAPAQMVGAVAAPQQETVIPGRQAFYIPEKTKWEADRLVTSFWVRQLLEPIVERYDRRVTAKRAEKRSIFKLDGKGK